MSSNALQLACPPPSCLPIRGPISVRLAASPAEIRAAQRLRYEVFFEEWGAIPDDLAAREQRDIEQFDSIAEHLIVVDQHRADAGINCGVVGNYRLLRGGDRSRSSAFYSAGEFDIAPLLNSGSSLLELGRSCVLREYRDRPVLQSLWSALAAYVAAHRIELMFGCASFRGTDPAAIAEPLAYLHHHHLAPAALRPRALPAHRLEMDGMPRERIDPVRALRAMEPLIRGYLRLGATVGSGATLDRRFNSIDVCVVLATRHLTARYARHYARNRSAPGLLATDGHDNERNGIDPSTTRTAE
ncbi:MAG: GNAT family N-acyltransferase [Luteimonas sp.]